MVLRVQTIKILMKMPPRRRGAPQKGAGNQELEELRRRIEELENRRNGEEELESEAKEEIDVDHNDENKDLVVLLISYLAKRGSARVEISCYDGILRAENLIDWI